MGCGSSVQATQPTPSDQRILSAPVSPVVETENDPPMTSDPEHVGFRVNPEPHEEFFPTYSPTALELKCRSTIAKLGPRSSEESARKEMEELIRQWRESGKLADIESYSLSTPPSQSRSITELSEYLTRSTSNYVKAMEGNELHIQVAKAYCIYSWIAHNITYDSQLWQAYQFGDDSSLQHSTRAEQVIDRRMTVSSGYANLFKSIASASGLKVEVICGNIKEWKTLTMSSPKEDFKASRNNTHAWNSVSIVFL